MLVDYERVVLDLKDRIGAKSHHGQRELFALIAQLEVSHRIEEGLPETALRLYGLEFFDEAIKAPGSGRDCVPVADGHQVRALRGDSIPSPEEDTHVGSRSEARAGQARVGRVREVGAAQHR